ncbi:MAG: IS21-like element helper ATPase IstB [Lachnoclostridium sp.]|jgi:DNA replication protein DnaC|nr:IS21-like element helper ATPase IstB [Lachnoclostridium sp.]
MTKQATIDRLHEMRLTAMANAFESQSSDTKYEHLTFEDRFSLLVDTEWNKRRNNKLQKLICAGNFRYPNACIEDIDYQEDRKLDKTQMLEFSTCQYIHDNHHIILKGASGNGKTFLACSLGIAACRNYIKVRYIRLPDLLNELAIAHGEGIFHKVIKTYQKIDLLILDEFLLTPLSSDQARELLEIIEARSYRGSVIFCTQFEPRDWYERIGNESDATISEAIIDRIIHNSYEVLIDGRVSMRERYGIKPLSMGGGTLESTNK